MPLPFIVAGATLLAAGYGVKKGVDAKNDLEDAERYARDAEEQSEKANKKLEKQKFWTNSSLEAYGLSKKDGIKNINFFDSLIYYPNGESRNNKLVIGRKNTNTVEEKGLKIIITKEEEIYILKKLHIIDDKLSFKDAEQKIKARNIEMKKMDSALKSIASGSLAGLAAAGGSYLGVGAFAAASTGTAISGLSGVAATNATLAWLGGGSLASGGFGIAGGTAVLGGLVVGPLLAIGGAVMAAKAAGKKDEAYEQLSRIRGEIKKLDVVVSKLRSIENYTDECRSTFDMYNLKFKDILLPKLSNIAKRKVNGKNITYRDLNDVEKGIVWACYELSFLLYGFIKEPTLNSDGNDALPSNQRISLNKSKRLEYVPLYT